MPRTQVCQKVVFSTAISYPGIQIICVCASCKAQVTITSNQPLWERSSDFGIWPCDLLCLNTTLSIPSSRNVDKVVSQWGKDLTNCSPWFVFKFDTFPQVVKLNQWKVVFFHSRLWFGSCSTSYIARGQSSFLKSNVSRLFFLRAS